MKRFKISRIIRSKFYANIILANGLVPEFQVYKYNHPKIKSLYRLANLFLLNKKLLYKCPDVFINDVDMDCLFDYYYE